MGCPDGRGDNGKPSPERLKQRDRNPFVIGRESGQIIGCEVS